MSIIAIYIFSPTGFTTIKPFVIEQLVKDTPSGDYRAVPRKVSGQFTLDPGIYRCPAGTSITPGPVAAVAPMASASSASTTSVTGFVMSPIGSAKSSWPDPPATMASASLGVPMTAMKPFLTDAGAESTV